MIFEDLSLQTIQQFVDFDLEHDKELLEILELASAVTKMPHAVISFLDNDTSFLKVRHGITETSVPRNLSFCAHATKTDELLIVKDTLLDERFVNNPFVTTG